MSIVSPWIEALTSGFKAWRRAGRPTNTNRQRNTRTRCAETLEARRALSYTIINLGSLGGTDALPLDVNSKGAVVGFAYTANNAAAHAFLFSHGKLNDLGTLGGPMSEAMGINDSGQVVGLSQITPG